MRPLSGIKRRIDALAGFIPVRDNKRLRPAEWLGWHCHACRQTFMPKGKTPKFIRNRNQTLAEFLAAVEWLNYDVRFLCSDCFDIYRERFGDQLVVDRLTGEI